MPPTHQNTKIHQKNLNPIPEELDAIGKLIVDAAYTVHKNLGHGLLEKVYEICFSISFLVRFGDLVIWWQKILSAHQITV